VTDGVTRQPASIPGSADDGGDEERLRALMRRYQAGHLDGFDELYALASPAVRRFLGARLSDASRVEDLVQETFLRLHQARHTYDPAYPVRPWLLAIAKHTWLMDVRARARRPHATEPLAETHTLTSPAVDRLEDREEMRRALQDVVPGGRVPFLMHHVWGYSFAEIARRLGVSEAAAKLRSSRAMQSLRRALGASRREGRR
jgi:RNA polymerase sigma-70 factor (ECF subfamily)